MKLKKILSVLLCVITSFTMLVACDSNSGGYGDNGGDDGVQSQALFEISYLENGVYNSVSGGLSIYKGEKLNLYTVKPSGTTAKNEVYKSNDLSWNSSDKNVATVTQMNSTPHKGELRAVASGTSTISVSDKKGNVAEFTLTVKDVVISTTEPSKIVYVDDGNVILSLADMFSITDNLPLTYQSSNTDRAEVASNGNLIVKAAGVVTVTAYSASPKLSKSIELTVYDKAINLPSNEYVLEYNDSVKETADLTFTTKYSVSELNYSSSNNNVAVVENGKIVAKGTGNAVITISGGSGANADTLEISVSVVNKKSNTVSITSLTNEFVNLYGRNYFDLSKQAVKMEYTASGFEVKFYGTELKANLSMSGANYHSRMQVLVDGEMVDQTEAVVVNSNNAEKTATPAGQKIINLNKTNKTEYTLVSDLTEGWHTVKVLKRTPARRGGEIMDAVYLHSVTTDGYLVKAPSQANQLKIELYGDSISCAYGNLNNGDNMLDNNTNGLLGYHYLAAEKLGAQINIQAYSGWGIICDTASNATWLWPNYYDKFTDLSTSYDMSYDADVIVINLGTNDATYKGSDFVDKFSTATVAWVKKLLAKNSDAKVILSYGMMGNDSRVISGYNKAVVQLKSEGYNDVYFLEYPAANYDNSGHPGAQNHIANSKVLYNKINEVVNSGD